MSEKVKRLTRDGQRVDFDQMLSFQAKQGLKDILRETIRRGQVDQWKIMHLIKSFMQKYKRKREVGIWAFFPHFLLLHG